MRTDSQIQRDIIEQFDIEPTIHTSWIGVTVKHGVVTLTGKAASLVGQMTAEQLTKKVPGVVGVINDIDVLATVDSDASTVAAARQK